MPKFTVAMPAYNDAAYINEAINSILNQTVSDFELLIIDDGSTDDTPNIIESYNDKRLRIIHLEQNKGRPFVRNLALDEAQGEYLVWMDADDISLPHRLEKQAIFLDTHKDVALCGGYMQCFGDSTHLVRVKTAQDAVKANIIWHSSILNGTSCMRLKSIQEHGIRYHENLLRAQDYAFFAEVCLSTPLKAANIPEVLLHCRYFHRASTPTYHVKAVKYILQALNLPYDELTCHKHSILSIGKHDTMPSISDQDVLAWADEVYTKVLGRDDIVIEHFLRITHTKVENFLANVENAEPLLRAYAALPLGKTHNIQKLFMKYA